MTRRGRRRPPGAPLRIGLFGVLGSGNLGNDGSLDVVMAHLRRHHPEARVDFLAMGPDHVRERYTAPAEHLQWYEAHAERLAWAPPTVLKLVGRLVDPWRTLRWTRRHDVVLVPGAGVLETTTPVRPWALPLSLFTLSVAGRLSGTRVALVCVGADAVENRWTAWLFGGAARLAHYRSYRDDLSRDAVAALGVDVRGDRVYPDLAFGLEVPRRGRGRSGTIGVGVMRYRGADADRDRGVELHRAYLAAVLRLVEGLVRDGWRVRLVAGDREDEPVLALVTAATAHLLADDGSAAVVAEVVDTLPALMEVLNHVDLVVATRYHNVITALHLSVPTVSVGYARKSEVLMTSMGLGRFCQSAAAVDVDRLLRQVRILDASATEVRALLDERNRAQAAGVRRQLAALSAFLLGEAAPGPAEAHAEPVALS